MKKTLMFAIAALALDVLAGVPVTWNLAELGTAPKVFESGFPEKDGVKPIFYEGVPCAGKPTRVFAYLAVPKVKPGEKVPGLVLVHGGLGSAFRRWAKFWRDQGYAAISMDTCGCVSGNEYGNENTGHKRHEWAGPQGWGQYGDVGKCVEDQWMYHAVAAVVRANSLLRSLPEVDADRIGLTGVSWGGILTCVAGSVDPRFDFAAPVYGCGYLDDDSVWLDKVSDCGKGYTKEQFQKWCDLFDPRHYLADTKATFLWIDGSNDFAFPLPSLQKSVATPKTPYYRATRVRMAHNHSAISEHPQELVDFAEFRLRKRTRKTYPFVRLCEENEGRVRAEYQCGEDRIVRAELNVTADTGKWQKRDWKILPMALNEGYANAEAELPVGTVAWYVNFFTANGKCLSGELVERTPLAVAAHKACMAEANCRAATVELTVLQSTDLHGSPAVAKYAKWIAAERAADPELLLVDCGDVCNGTFATWCDGGASMVSYLNLCRYDVWVPGNHEFRIGNANFRQDLSLFTAGSVLSANIAFDDPAKRPSVPILPWKMFTRKGLKIAVVGMASHRYDDWFDVKPYRGLRLLSPVEVLETVMPEVRAAKPDVIVVAMHSALTQPAETKAGNEDWISSKDAYAKYPEIVLILQGHTHNTVPATEFEPGRWIVQPRDNGGSMAKIRVSFDTASRKVTKVASEFVEAKKLPETDDAHMPEAWRRNNAVAAAAEKTPIVRIPEEFVWRPKEQKGGLPPTLLAEAMREAAGSDAAIVNSVEIFRPTTRDLTQRFFFSEPPKSGITVLTLSPDQLKKALAASGSIERRSVGIDVKNLPEKTITVAFDAYDLAGCDGKRMGLRELARSGVPRREVEVNMREALRAYMLKRWPIQPR